MLGQQWSRESSEVKARWKSVADDIKKKHSAMFPDYQYQPRKPSEKKRRMTLRKVAALAGMSAAQLPAHPQHGAATGSSSDQSQASASASPVTDTESGESSKALDVMVNRLTVEEMLAAEPFPEPTPTFETAANGDLYFDLDGVVTDEAFSAMLTEYNGSNKSTPAPAPPQPSAIVPNDYPVHSFTPAEDSSNDQTFFTDICDWEALFYEAKTSAEEALAGYQPDVQYPDWEQEWSALASAELERMPTDTTCPLAE